METIDLDIVRKSNLDSCSSRGSVVYVYPTHVDHGLTDRVSTELSGIVVFLHVTLSGHLFYRST